jgi:hypothetical protein
MHRKILSVHGEDKKRLLAYSHMARDIKRSISRLISAENVNKVLDPLLYSRCVILRTKTILRYCPFALCEGDEKEILFIGLG